MTSPLVIVSLVFAFTMLNFLLWARANHKEHSFPLMNHALLSRNVSEKRVGDQLAEIRNKISENKKLLESMYDSKFGSEEDMFKNMKEYSVKQVPLRKRTLASIFKYQQYANLYGSLAPEVFCPGKVRIGTIGDGGKWACNPWKVPDQSVLFSLGLNNFIGFESDWQRLVSNRNVLYGFDSAEQSESTKKVYASLSGTSMKALISPKTKATADEFTIEDLAKHFSVTAIEIMKVDIEGAEKTCLIPFLEKFTVCQMYLEIHGGAEEHAKLLREIAHLDYRLFSFEVNGFEMSACEYSFIHESCVMKYGAKRIAYYLDFEN